MFNANHYSIDPDRAKLLQGLLDEHAMLIDELTKICERAADLDRAITNALDALIERK